MWDKNICETSNLCMCEIYVVSVACSRGPLSLSASGYEYYVHQVMSTIYMGDGHMRHNANVCLKVALQYSYRYCFWCRYVSRLYSQCRSITYHHQSVYLPGQPRWDRHWCRTLLLVWTFPGAHQFCQTKKRLAFCTFKERRKKSHLVMDGVIVNNQHQKEISVLWSNMS